MMTTTHSTFISTHRMLIFLLGVQVTAYSADAQLHRLAIKYYR